MGYVYFIWASEGQRVKIGRSCNPERRFNSLRTSSSEELHFLGCVATDDAIALERDLHRIWGAWRVRGEWFTATAELIDFIRQACRPRVTYMKTGRPRTPIADVARKFARNTSV